MVGSQQQQQQQKKEDKHIKVHKYVKKNNVAYIFLVEKGKFKKYITAYLKIYSPFRESFCDIIFTHTHKQTSTIMNIHCPIKRQ